MRFHIKSSSYHHYGCTMPTIPVLCLYYAYYTCTMPNMPVLCLLCPYYDYYVYYTCTCVLCLLCLFITTVRMGLVKIDCIIIDQH